MATIGYVYAADAAATALEATRPPDAADRSRGDGVAIDEALWAVLEREGVADALSAAAEGLVGRYEEGWFEPGRIDALLGILEGGAARVADPRVADWVARVQALARAAQARGVPLVFALS